MILDWQRIPLATSIWKKTRSVVWGNTIRPDAWRNLLHAFRQGHQCKNFFKNMEKNLLQHWWASWRTDTVAPWFWEANQKGDNDLQNTGERFHHSIQTPPFPRGWLRLLSGCVRVAQAAQRLTQASWRLVQATVANSGHREANSGSLKAILGCRKDNSCHLKANSGRL